MKLEHVIGRDGLHRLRLTSEQNGQIFDNSHEGLSSRHETFQNLKRKLTAYLMLGGIEAVLAEAMAISIVHNIDATDIPTVDNRPTPRCGPEEEALITEVNKAEEFQRFDRAEILHFPAVYRHAVRLAKFVPSVPEAVTTPTRIVEMDPASGAYKEVNMGYGSCGGRPFKFFERLVGMLKAGRKLRGEMRPECVEWRNSIGNPIDPANVLAPYDATDIPTVDERVQDPLEPQTQTPEN